MKNTYVRNDQRKSITINWTEEHLWDFLVDHWDFLAIKINADTFPSEVEFEAGSNKRETGGENDDAEDNQTFEFT